jgi:caa(3)-type oxidase subunit IV
MAEKGKKKDGDGKSKAEGQKAEKKAEGAKAEKKAEAKAEEKAEKAHAEEHGHDHGHGAAAHAAHAPNYREYFIIFAVLFVLTVLEVGVAKLPGLSRTLVGIALVGLAVTKATCVGLYYMHLKHETRVLKLTVAIPMATPAVYALVLIGEAAWRLTR